MAEAAQSELELRNSGSNLSHRQQKAVKKKFEKADTGKDGILNRDEFAAMFPAEQRRQSIMMFNQLDTDRSGGLDYDEFISIAEKVKKNYDTKRKKAHVDRRSLLLPMKRLFHRLDSNNDSKLSNKEFSRLWRVLNIPEERAEQVMANLFKCVDKNKDGFISNREFKDAFIDSGILNEVLESVFSAELPKIPKQSTNSSEKKLNDAEEIKRKSLQAKFNQLDTDGDDLLTLDELRRFCETVYISNVDGVVNSVDPDKSGKFPFTEFVDCMSRAKFMTGAEIKALQKAQAKRG